VDRIAEQVGARFLVTSEGFRREAQRAGVRSVLEAVRTPEELAGLSVEPDFEPPRVHAGDIAFLQLTSGSTGHPRAVMIPHRAAIHNPLASSEAIGMPHGAPAHTWADSMVSWLPLYHDMGLVGCLLLPILSGLDLWLMRPETFLARPKIWLENLSRRGKSFAPAPNFGYQLCVDRIDGEEIRTLNLSSWRCALTGAEMIRPETVEAFCQTFATSGFSRKALRPCYGLAEATLAVTFDLKGEGLRTQPLPAGADSGYGLNEVVCVGEPLRDTQLRIVAPDGAVLPEATIGEVLVKGAGVFSGYYQDAEATAETLQEGWMATGDLGFLHDGELYLTGRVKDLLILHGHNVMPDELERIADSASGGGGLRRSGAFSVARGSEGERAVVVVEVGERDPKALEALDHEVRVRIGRGLGLPLADLVFVRRGRIPRTSSGKVQRRELRARYLENELERLQGLP
jgi:acyl-CoA synthetase (AMP-forming)/AMP-acid ligase II